MPARRVHIEGQEWQVFPSGFLTPSAGDEFGLIFVHTRDGAEEVRVTRYSPAARSTSTAREHSLAALSDTELRALFSMSQSSARSPDAGYRP